MNRKLGMLTLALLLYPKLMAAPPDGAEPRELIKKSIDAHGGAEKLDRLRLVREETRGTIEIAGIKTEFTAEALQRLPAQFRHTLKAEIAGKKLHVIQVFDGKDGWLKEGGELRPTDERTREGWKATAHAAHLASLTPLLAGDKGYRFTALGEAKVLDKPALGVKIACPNQRDVNLWFDRASGLLVKKDLRPHAGSPASLQEEIFSDFRDIDGLQRPSRMRILINGELHAEGRIVATKFLDKLDDKEFGKP